MYGYLSTKLPSKALFLPQFKVAKLSSSFLQRFCEHHTQSLRSGCNALECPVAKMFPAKCCVCLAHTREARHCKLQELNSLVSSKCAELPIFWS